MAFLFADSFETAPTGIFSTDGPLRGWSSASWGDITTVEFKDGTQCLRLEGNESAAWEIPVADEPGPVTPGFLSFWFRMQTVPTSRRTIAGFNSSGSYILVFVVEADGTLQWRFNSADVGPASTLSLVDDVWYHIEVKFEFVDSTSVGSCVIYVDGVEWVDLGAGIDTAFISFNETEGFRFHGQGLAGTFFWFDSPIFWNGVAGDDWNDLRGIIRCETKAPDANGQDADFVGSDGNSVDNYLQVDEINDLHDGDTTYNESPTDAANDSYNFPDIVASDVQAIIGVQVAMVSKKTGAGALDLTPFFVDGGIDHLGTEHVLTNGTYTFGSHMYDEDPEATAAWTAAKISSGHFGLRVT
jgi:hypothetical protein